VNIPFKISIPEAKALHELQRKVVGTRDDKFDLDVILAGVQNSLLNAALLSSRGKIRDFVEFSIENRHAGALMDILDERGYQVTTKIDSPPGRTYFLVKWDQS
jgi:hypothetical protein